MTTVWPKNEAVRAVLKHLNGVGFAAGGGSAEWPDDKFTQRRIEDGDVLTHPAQGSIDAPTDLILRTRPRPTPTTAPTVTIA